MSEVTDFVPIEGYEGLYEINRSGIIRSLSHTMPYGDSFRFHKGRVLKACLNKNFIYQRLRLSKNGIAVSFNAHRLVAMTFIDNPLNLPQVNHKNGIQHDNRVENLEWSTAKSNMEHASLNGLVAHGTRQHSAKLTDEIVKRIITSKDSLRVLANKYGVTPQAISYIRNGKTWRQSLWGNKK